jgi:hypothetical protein
MQFAPICDGKQTLIWAKFDAAPASNCEIEDKDSALAARRRDDTGTDGTMPRILKIGIARRDINEIGDKAFLKAFRQPLGADIRSSRKGQHARQNAAQTVEIGINPVALGPTDRVAETQEYTVADHRVALS